MIKKTYKLTAKKIVFREEKDGALLFNPDNGSIQVLNKTGACIWKACIKGVTLNSMTKLLKARFDCKDESKLEQDIQRFIKILKTHKYMK
ncbi:MAG TPA: PqqD family protein [bacterium]